MKVVLEEKYKQFYTIEDLEHAKAVIKAEKENDESTIKSWAVYAANEIGKKYRDCTTESNILQASAHTAKNSRAWNEYGDDTGNMDVWIEFTAWTGYRFIKGGAYLSDIWQTGAVDYTDHMYYTVYEAVK